MGQEELKILLQFFKALADESRLKILGLLSNREHSVGELAAALGLKEPTVSHHLAKLKDLGLVEMRPDGNNRLYRLNPPALERLNKQMFSQEQLASWVDDIEAEDWERKVLADYFEDGRLREIPGKYKKFMVIVRWMAGRFEPGVQYTEKQVNEIIKQYHEDFASFRRAMVDHGYMQRERGIYWLADPQPEAEF